MQRGCSNETVANKALMSGSSAGPRPVLTASVFTTRRSSARSSNTLMRMLRGARNRTGLGRHTRRCCEVSGPSSR
jgi:hypothetical protein